MTQNISCWPPHTMHREKERHEGRIRYPCSREKWHTFGCWDNARHKRRAVSQPTWHFQSTKSSTSASSSYSCGQLPPRSDDPRGAVHSQHAFTSTRLRGGKSSPLPRKVVTLEIHIALEIRPLVNLATFAIAFEAVVLGQHLLPSVVVLSRVDV